MCIRDRCCAFEKNTGCSGYFWFGSPIPVPQRNVYAVGWNYLEHFEEGKAMRDPNQKYPEHPVFFSKAQHCVNGPFSPIPFDAAVSKMIDWEGELAVIVGKRGRNIPEASAMEYVFGFAVINDTTARDLQQTRHGVAVCNPCVPWAGSLSLGRSAKNQ